MPTLPPGLHYTSYSFARTVATYREAILIEAMGYGQGEKRINNLCQFLQRTSLV